MPIFSLGSEAARILRKCQSGHVLAVFKRSFYIQCGGCVLCVGLPSLGEGPLHVLLASNQNHLPKEIINDLSVKVGCNPTRCAESDLELCVRSSNEDNMQLYSGRVIFKASSPLALQLVQQSLLTLAPPQPHGFGWMVGNPDWHCHNTSPEDSAAGLDALERSLRLHCMPALLILSQWLRQSLERHDEKYRDESARVNDANVRCTQCVVAITDEMSSQVPNLLGAGLGLTPSGDDLLAGIMLALHRINRTDLANALWELLEPKVGSRTNIISCAHLQLAAKGQCSEPMLQLLEYLFSNNIVKQRNGVKAAGVQAAADDIQTLANRIGASSGWDTLAGMSLVLRAL